MIEENLRTEWEVRMDRVSQIKQLLPVLVVLILLVAIALSIPPKPTGFVTVSDEFNYSDDVNINLNDSYEYVWVAGNYGELTSVRVDGSVSREGSAKIYLEYDNESYLVFDSLRLEDNNIIDYASLDDESEEIVDLVDEEKNKQIIIKVEGGGSKDIGDMFEFNVSGSFNWDVSYDKVCTRWSLTSSNSLNLPTSAELDGVSHPDAEEGSAELIDGVNEISLCYGSSDCCALIGLESSGDWNSSFYLSYGRYGVELINIVKTQVIYANYSLDIENPYADVVYSDVSLLEAEFYGEMISFEDICIDTCLLPGFNASGYKLIVEINDAVLSIDKIGYSVFEEVANNAPVLIKNISILNIIKNENLTIDLSEYFTDLEGDELTYSYYNVENITILIDNSLATTIPDKGFTGERYSFFRANDSSLTTVSDLFTINVSETEVNITPKLKANKKDFGLDEDALFEFEYLSESGLIKQDKSLEMLIKDKQKKKWIAEDETIETFVYDSLGRLTTIELEIEELREGKFKITLPKQRTLRAGKYRLRIELIKDGETYIEEQEFTWGVLAINTHKSIYLPDELADIGIAVLDDRGHMVCDADVTLEIIDPLNQKTVLSTSNGLIKVSPECEVYGVTTLPDYYTNYTVSGVGNYVMNLTAVTFNGVRTITDEFVVQSSVDFDVARDGPTRIYPPVAYVMNFTIKANKNYNGPIREFVPSSFNITPQPGLMTIRNMDVQVLVWNKELKAGETYTFGYEFDAPDTSPEFYLLGPLEIGKWKEYRYWQIASDSVKLQDLTAIAAPDPVNELASFTATFTFNTNIGGGTLESGSIYVTYGATASENDATDGSAITPVDTDCTGNVLQVTGRSYTCDGTQLTCDYDANGYGISYAVGAKGTTTQTMEWTIQACSGSAGIYDIGVEQTGGTGTLVSWHDSLNVNVPSDNKGPSWSANKTNSSATTPTINDVIQINITVEDSSGVSMIRLATNDSGTMRNESEYQMNVSGAPTSVTAIFNFTVTANNTAVRWQVWANDSSSNANINVSLIRTFVVQNTVPTQPQIIYPVDGKNYTNVTAINYSSGDADGDPLTFQIYINNSLNTTIYGGNLTLWNASDGFYNLTVVANDGKESSPNSSVVHFRLDSVEPSFSNNETNATLMKINGNATFNITITDNGVGLSYYIFSWNGTGAWDNATNGSISGSSQKLVINKSTSLSQGNTIGYMWYANDSLNQWNNSLLRTFTVVNTVPDTPDIIYPSDGKNYTNVTAINYSSGDADGDPLTFEIYINNSLNTTIFEGNLTLWNASDGFYNLTVVANDNTDSSANSSVVHFRLDSVEPSFSNNETNATANVYKGTTVQLNLTITDDGGIDFYRLTTNDTAGGTWANESLNDTFKTSVIAIFNYTIDNFGGGGTLGWRVWANDSAGNVNISDIYTLYIEASDSCDCPTSGDWNIIDGDQCSRSTPCNIGSNKFRVLDGAMRILSGGKIRAGGCYVADGQSLYVDNDGGLYCEG